MDTSATLVICTIFIYFFPSVSAKPPHILFIVADDLDPTLDGIDQWDSLQKAGESKRTEFIYNIDDLKPENCGHAAIRMGDYKLIDGYPGAYQDWYKPDQVVSDLYKNVSINHTRPFDDIMMLFNLKDDPNEHVDLSNKHPDITINLASFEDLDPTLDGIDQWDSLQKAGESKRTEFIYNIDDLKPENCGHAAIRMGDYKLIDGYPGAYQDWYKPDQVVSDLYKNVSINHTRPFDDIMMLFNLKDDPNEHVDLSNKHPDIVKKLKSRLEYYHKQIVPANFPSISPSSAPSNYGGFWTPGWN
uniref:Arylsulfatase J n=1 Tax=Magallana gigas TaxID=29159 RepID=K1Q0H9_MAGGI